MTTRTVVVEPTELRCRNEHPSAANRNPTVAARFKGRHHSAVIGNLPFLCRPTGRILHAVSEARIGCVPAYCSDCKAYTEYEVIAPETAVPSEVRR